MFSFLGIETPLMIIIRIPIAIKIQPTAFIKLFLVNGNIIQIPLGTKSLFPHYSFAFSVHPF
jgi:hypothetical protein